MHVLVFINYWIEKCTVKHWNSLRHLFNLTHHRFLLIKLLPLHACYMFRPVILRHVNTKSYRGRYNKNLKKGLSFLLYLPLHTCKGNNWVKINLSSFTLSKCGLLRVKCCNELWRICEGFQIKGSRWYSKYWYWLRSLYLTLVLVWAGESWPFLVCYQ